MFKWIHHILEPHCPGCAAEAEAARECKSCNSLIHQLEVANFENRKLVDIISDISRPAPAQAQQVQEQPRAVGSPPNWRVIKQQLEANDRKEAAILREKQAESQALRAADLARGASGGLLTNNPNQSNSNPFNTIEELEKELGVSNAVPELR